MNIKERNRIIELLTEFNNRKSRELDSIDIDSFIEAVESK